MTFGRLGSLGNGFGRLGSGQGGAAPLGTIIAGAGSYVWTGQDATLTFTEQRSVAADSGSYAWTVADATLIHNRIIAASGGSYTYTGQDATLTYSGGGESLTRAYFAGEIEPGLYPEQLYGRELALLATPTPETFEMQ